MSDEPLLYTSSCVCGKHKTRHTQIFSYLTYLPFKWFANQIQRRILVLHLPDFILSSKNFKCSLHNINTLMSLSCCLSKRMRFEYKNVFHTTLPRLHSYIPWKKLILPFHPSHKYSSFFSPTSAYVFILFYSCFFN